MSVDSLVNYQDDIDELDNFIKNNYEKPTEDLIKFDKEEFMRTQINYTTSRDIIKKIKLNPFKDPLEVIIAIEDEYSMNVITSKQTINQNHFRVCCDLTSDLIKHLVKRRGMVEYEH